MVGDQLEKEFDYGERYWKDTIKISQPLFREGTSYMLKTKFWVKYIKKLKEKGRLLDAGCGKGFFLKEAEKHYSTWGVDIDNFNVLQSRYATKNSSILLADISDLSCFNNEFFDIVTAFNVLEHVQNPSKALDEIKRVLRNGGLLVITTPNLNSIGRKLKGSKWYGTADPTHISLKKEEDWLNLLKRKRFQIIVLFYSGFWNTPYFRFIPSILQHLLIRVPSVILFHLGLRFPKIGETLYIVSYKRTLKD